MTDRKRTDKKNTKRRIGPLDWDDLRHILELARQGSLSGAARALGVHHATVARRLSRLETALGTSLFEVRAEGFRPTAAGQAVLAEAAFMEAAALSVLRRRDATSGLEGLVRLTATRAFAARFLAPRLAALAHRHPGIELEVLTESRNMSLARREADIALRLSRPRDGETLARRIAVLGYRLYAAPSLAGRAEPPIIAYDDSGADLPEAVWLARVLAGRRVALRSNSLDVQVEAARAGLGAALLPCFLGDADPALEPLPAPEAPPRRDIWLMIRRDLAKVPRVRAVADYLVEIVSRDRAVLAGDRF